MSAKFTLEGSGAGAVKAVQDYNDALTEAQKKGEEAARASKKLEDAARRIAEQADPQKKYNRQLQEMAEHVAAGRLAHEDAEKAAAALGRQLYENSEEGKKAAADSIRAAEQEKKRAENQKKSLAIALEAQKRLVQVEKEKAVAAARAAKEEEDFAAAAQKIRESISPHEKLNRLTEELAKHVKAGTLSMEEATRAHRKYREELGLANQETKETFGDSFVAKLVGATAGFTSISGAVSLLTNGLQAMKDRAKEASDSLISSLGAAGELQQLGPESFSRGAANARRLVRSGVTTDLSQAFDIATNLENSGFSESELNFIIDKLAASRVVSASNLETTAGSLKKFQAAFGTEAGDLSEIVDKSLFVSTIPGVQTGLSQTVNETLKFASLFKSAGFSDEQALAAFAASESISPSADNASEGLKSYAAQINKRGLVKGGFYGTLENIESQIAGGKTAFDVLGEQNAVIGYQRLIQQRDFIREQEAAISKAGGALGESAGLLNTDPNLRAANIRASAEGELAFTQEQMTSRRASISAAIQAERKAAAIRAGGWEEFAESAASYLPKATDQYYIDRAMEQINLEEIGGPQSPFSKGLEDEIKDYMRRTAEASESTNRAVGAKLRTQQE